MYLFHGVSFLTRSPPLPKGSKLPWAVTSSLQPAAPPTAIYRDFDTAQSAKFASELPISSLDFSTVDGFQRIAFSIFFLCVRVCLVYSLCGQECLGGVGVVFGSFVWRFWRLLLGLYCDWEWLRGILATTWGYWWRCGAGWASVLGKGKGIWWTLLIQ